MLRSGNGAGEVGARDGTEPSGGGLAAGGLDGQLDRRVDLQLGPTRPGRAATSSPSDGPRRREGLAEDRLRRRPIAAPRARAAAHPTRPASVNATSWSPRLTARIRDVLQQGHQRPEVVEVAVRLDRRRRRPRRPRRAGRARAARRPGCSGRSPRFSRSPTSMASRIASSHRRRCRLVIAGHAVHPGEVDLAGCRCVDGHRVRVYSRQGAVAVRAGRRRRRPAAGRRCRGCSSVAATPASSPSPSRIARLCHSSASRASSVSPRWAATVPVTWSTSAAPASSPIARNPSRAAGRSDCRIVEASDATGRLGQEWSQRATSRGSSMPRPPPPAPPGRSSRRAGSSPMTWRTSASGIGRSTRSRPSSRGVSRSR